MQEKNSLVVAFVADFRYLYKNFPRIFKELREVGKYNGEILIITSFLTPTFLIKEINKSNKVSVLKFKKLKFSRYAEKSLKNLNSSPNRHLLRRFQWYKLYLFHEKLKKWKYIFYLDINMNIHSDINAILNIKPENNLLARADGYPNYEWLLESQFDTKHPKIENLRSNFNLNLNNYFQTGLLFFDTQIIQKNTLKQIIEIVEKYPLSITNEQGILNLYFIFINNKYEQLIQEIDERLSYYYWLLPDKEVIISKAKSIKNK